MAEGSIREKLQYKDIFETIELICDELTSCRDLLKIRPFFKRHSDNFDKILKVIFLFCSVHPCLTSFFLTDSNPSVVYSERNQHNTRTER